MTPAQRRVLEAMAKGDELVRVSLDDLPTWQPCWFLYDGNTPVHGSTINGLLMHGYIALDEDTERNAVITEAGRAALR